MPSASACSPSSPAVTLAGSAAGPVRRIKPRATLGLSGGHGVRGRRLSAAIRLSVLMRPAG